MAVPDNQITVDVLNHLVFEGDREYKVNYSWRFGVIEWVDIDLKVYYPHTVATQLYSMRNGSAHCFHWAQPVKSIVTFDLVEVEVWT